MSQTKGCQFLLTRGAREGMPCGRAVYRKVHGAESCLCLQHIRMIDANSKHQRNAPEFKQFWEATASINLPEPTLRTPMPPILEDEVIEIKEESDPSSTDSDEMNDVIQMLTQMKREIKTTKK